ncbi:MAG: hypothetical protein Ct9H300mP25_10300 [Acidobacteriota bacterium]|nr:MAG: hypothetical protein Ct9H300mP25_10300 [Acidobacteriota bacterium]
MNSPPLITPRRLIKKHNWQHLTINWRSARSVCRNGAGSQAAQAEWESSLAASLPIDWSLTDQLVDIILLMATLPVSCNRQNRSGGFGRWIAQFVEGGGTAASFDGRRFLNAGNHQKLDTTTSGLRCMDLPDGEQWRHCFSCQWGRPGRGRLGAVSGRWKGPLEFVNACSR